MDNIGIDLSTKLGPLYWGFVISLVLGGITVLQAYIYFPRTQDRISIQILAALMLSLDTLSSALTAQSVYYYLIPHFGSLVPLSAITHELSVECVVSTIITFISQVYFAKQIYSMASGRRNWIVPASVLVFAVCALAGGIACTAAMFIHSGAVLGNRAKAFSVFFGVAKGFGALTDVVATAAMCIYLSSARSGLKQTNSLINRIIVIVLERGVLVTLIQTLLVITFFMIPNNLYWLAFHVNVTKLYVNIFFSMLNARASLAEERSKSISMSVGPSGVLSRRGESSYHFSSPNHDFDVKSFNPTKSGGEMPTISKTVVVQDI